MNYDQQPGLFIGGIEPYGKTRFYPGPPIKPVAANNTIYHSLKYDKVVKL